MLGGIYALKKVILVTDRSGLQRIVSPRTKTHQLRSVKIYFQIRRSAFQLRSSLGTQVDYEVIKSQQTNKYNRYKTVESLVLLYNTGILIRWNEYICNQVYLFWNDVIQTQNNKLYLYNTPINFHDPVSILQRRQLWIFYFNILLAGIRTVDKRERKFTWYVFIFLIENITIFIFCTKQIRSIEQVNVIN